MRVREGGCCEGFTKKLMEIADITSDLADFSDFISSSMWPLQSVGRLANPFCKTAKNKTSFRCE